MMTPALRLFAALMTGLVATTAVSVRLLKLLAETIGLKQLKDFKLFVPPSIMNSLSASTYFLPSFPNNFQSSSREDWWTNLFFPLHAGHVQRPGHHPAALLHLAHDRLVPRRILPHPGPGLGLPRGVRRHDAEVPGLHAVDGKRPVHAQGHLPGAGAGGQVSVERL